MARTKSAISGVLMALAMAGCAHSPAEDPAGPPPTSPAAYGATSSSASSSISGASAGDWAVAVVGMPFYLAFKAVVCAGSLVVAAPASAMFALGGPGPGSEAIDSLGDGLQQNCGPPYVLTP